MYISQVITQEGAPITPAQFTAQLGLIAQDMHNKGWDVIGSFCKTPNLRPWKGVHRTELINGTLEDIRTGRANSINLRLRDNVIALDCDFHDPSLMDVFVKELGSLLGVNPRVFYTVHGGKGGKLFFRYSEGKPPRHLGPVAYTKGFAGNPLAKQELEIKADLSTVAGLYGGVTLTDEHGQKYEDAIVYTSYEGTRSILSARPSDLLVITKRDLEAIEELYVDLLRRGQFVSETGEEISPKYYQLTNLAAVASYMMRIACKQQDGFDYGQFLSDSMHDPEFDGLIAPYYTYLHLDDALAIIRRLFHDGPCVSIELEREAAFLVSLAKAGNLASLSSRASGLGLLTRKAKERLSNKGKSLGMSSEVYDMEPLQLFALLRKEGK